MRVTNDSKRVVNLGGRVSLAPGKSIAIAADAMWLTRSPLFKAYVKDKTLSVYDGKPAKQKLDAKAPKADAKEKLTA